METYQDCPAMFYPSSKHCYHLCMPGPMKFGETSVVPDSEKIDKESVAQEAIDPGCKIGGDTLPDIMKRNKWALGLAKGKENYSREATRLQVDGLLRGAISERISHLLRPPTLDYVIPTDNANLSNVLEGAEMVAPANLDQPTMGVKRRGRDPNRESYWRSPRPNRGWGKGTKVGLAQGMVAETLEVPDAIFNEDVEYSDFGDISDPRVRDELRDRYMAEVIEGYGGGSRKVKPYKTLEGDVRDRTDEGLDYGEMTLPDGFLVYQGEVFGVVEVKAYTPEEFRVYVDKAVKERSMKVFVEDSENGDGQNGNHYRGGMNLGLDVEGEQFMVDRLLDAKNAREHKAKTGEVPPALRPMGPIIPVVLRVLDDVEDEDIQRLTVLAHDLGYPNFLVQKLPFSSEDVSSLVPEALRGMAPTLLDGEDFSSREKDVIKNLMGNPGER